MKIAPISLTVIGKNADTSATMATQEPQLRIRASRLGDVLAGMAFDLCLEQVPVEEALQQIQERAIERIMALLDSSILSDEATVKSCLDIVAKESEDVAWQALEKGIDALREGLEAYDALASAESAGPVN